MREGVPSKIWIVVKLKYFIPLTHKQLTKCKSSYLAKQKKPWGEEQFTCAKLIFLYLWSMPKKTKIWSCFVVSNWIAPRKELALSKLNHNNRSENTQSKTPTVKTFPQICWLLNGSGSHFNFPRNNNGNSRIYYHYKNCFERNCVVNSLIRTATVKEVKVEMVCITDVYMNLYLTCTTTTTTTTSNNNNLRVTLHLGEWRGYSPRKLISCSFCLRKEFLELTTDKLTNKSQL